MAEYPSKDEQNEDPITRVVRMAQTGEVSNITVQMLEEALEYRKELDRMLAQQGKESTPS